MKKLIASLTILATGAALASSVSSSATFGVLKITSSAKETAISVPWVAAGAAADATEVVAAIKVKDFVKTSNLTGVENEEDCEDADILLVYDPSTKAYKGWYLKENNGNKVWTGLGISYNGISAAAGDDSDTLTRGQALILIRTSTSLAAEDHAIYLYGQYKNPPTNYTITRAAGRTTLFAPVNTTSTGVSINSLTWNNAETGDTIKLQGAIPLVFSYDADKPAGSKWGIQFGGNWITDGAVIRPGEGVWYTTVSGGSAVEVE